MKNNTRDIQARNMHVKSPLLSRKGFWLLLCAAVFSQGVMGQAAGTGSTTPAGKGVTEQVRIGGLFVHPGVLTLDSLKKMPVVERRDVRVTGAKGETRKSFQSVKGVLLKDVVEAAGIDMSSPKERGKYYIRVTASDGYTVLFSYDELEFSAAGGNTLLLFEEDGAPISGDGLFVVLCTTDPISGPRHVKWVQSIEAGKLP